jgi:hypothetical protein
MGKVNVGNIHTIKQRLAQAHERQSKITYYRIEDIDGTFMIATTPNRGIVKTDLTEAECNAWMRLLMGGGE